MTYFYGTLWWAKETNSEVTLHCGGPNSQDKKKYKTWPSATQVCEIICH